MHARPARRSALACAVLAAVACGTTPDPKPPENKNPPAPAGPSVGTPELVGGFSAGQARAMLTGTNGTTALVGLSGVPLDPKWLGADVPANDQGFFIPSGLLAADSNGHVRVYGVADGLPEMSYDDGAKDWGKAAAPFFSLAWITPDHVFAGASWHFVVRGEVDANGTWKFTHATLRAEGAAADAFVGQVATAGGELFVGTDQGVAVLDPANLSVKRWIDLSGVTGGKGVSALASADFGGSAVVALLGPTGRDARTIAVLRPGSAEAQLVTVPPGQAATAVYGAPGFTVVGVTESDGRGALRLLADSVDGPVLTSMVSADDLAASSDGTLVPHRLAWDSGRGVLLVGGELRAGGKGGGLVKIFLAPDGSGAGRAMDAIDRADPYRPLLPKQVDTLEVDALGRWWVAGQSMCSEHKLGVVGLQRIEQDAGAVALVRPWISGVREIAMQENGQIWLGLRDEVPGLVCDGATVQTGSCRLRADGACVVYTPVITADLSLFSPAPSVSRYAFGDVARQEFAIATTGDELYLRRGQTTRRISIQLDPENLHLRLTSAAFASDGALWLGSETEWRYDPELDNDKVNARSPHGLGWFEVKEDASVGELRRYVRVASDNPNHDVAGLPSNQVWDVLPLDGTRHALVALGVERAAKTYDHLLPDADEHHVNGGLAIVEDAKIEVIPAPSGTTFGDVVALARDASGKVWALDAEAGVFAVDVAKKTATRFAAPAWSSPVRATSLAVDRDGHLAVGTTKGVWVYGANGGVSQVVDGSHGTTWAVRFLGKGFLAAGTDAGLLRVAIDGGAAVSAPASIVNRELWELNWGCHGGPGCACSPERPCISDNTCDIPVGELVGVCNPPDPCRDAPGSAGCVCSANADCARGLACNCSIDLCTCEPMQTCESDCSCTGDGVVDGCPTGSTCQSGIAGSSCVKEGPPPPPACARDCSCSGPETTTDGCPTGFECQSGFAGESCIETGPQQPSCADDCTCTGPDTTADGCPTGFECQAGIGGNTCAEAPPPPGPGGLRCAMTCSCTGPGATPDGCPAGKSCVTDPHGQSCQ